MNSVLLVLLGALLIVLIVASYVIASFGFTAIFGAPFVRTPKGHVRQMLKFASFKEGETIMDLGCGDGQSLLVAAEEFGAKNAYGYDINPLLILFGRWKARRAGLSDRIVFQRKNISSVEAPQVDVVFLYLLPRLMSVAKRTLVLLKPETRIVSRGFEFPDVQPREVGEGHRSQYYLYHVEDLV